MSFSIRWLILTSTPLNPRDCAVSNNFTCCAAGWLSSSLKCNQKLAAISWQSISRTHCINGDDAARDISSISHSAERGDFIWFRADLRFVPRPNGVHLTMHWPCKAFSWCSVIWPLWALHHGDYFYTQLQRLHPLPKTLLKFFGVDFPNTLLNVSAGIPVEVLETSTTTLFLLSPYSSISSQPCAPAITAKNRNSDIGK